MRGRLGRRHHRRSHRDPRAGGRRRRAMQRHVTSMRARRETPSPSSRCCSAAPTDRSRQGRRCPRSRSRNRPPPCSGGRTPTPAGYATRRPNPTRTCGPSIPAPRTRSSPRRSPRRPTTGDDIHLDLATRRRLLATYGIEMAPATEIDAGAPPSPTPTRSVTPSRSRPYAAVPAGRRGPASHSTSPPTTTSSRRSR